VFFRTFKIEVKGHLLSLKSYVSYATELKNKGTNVDIARVSTELQTRANVSNYVYVIFFNFSCQTY